MKNQTDIRDTLIDYEKRTNPFLLEFFNEQKAKTPKSLKYARAMLENVEEFCTRGGKRLRPALVYHGYKLVGGEDSKDILKASLAMELVHTFLLIHDDVIDEDILRRGGPTVHKLYEDEHKRLYNGNGNSAHFGESMGILAGDLSSCLAFKILLSSDFSSEIKNRVIGKLTETVTNTIFGEELDVRLEVNGLSKPAEILKVYYLKTARYTFEAPLQIGAMLAGLDESDLEIISQYAIPCGVAFQIQDDILGMFGDQNLTGKLVGSDLRQGKKTLLVAKALQKASDSDRKKIHAALGNKDLSEAETRRIREIIKQTGSLAYCEKLAGDFIYQAKTSLQKFSDRGWDRAAIEQLGSVSDLIVRREA